MCFLLVKIKDHLKVWVGWWLVGWIQGCKSAVKDGLHFTACNQKSIFLYTNTQEKKPIGNTILEQDIKPSIYIGKNQLKFT